MARKFFPGAAIGGAQLGERQIKVVASTATPDRVGDVMDPVGCDLANFKSNPIVLANHDPAFPIGTADVAIVDGRIEALIDFAPKGASAKADEYCALAKAGVLGAVSVGFEPVSARPNKSGGLDYAKWELLELSLVSVPCNPEATVIQRSLGKTDGENWKCGASRNLPVSDDDGWDGPEAEKSIFDHCDFEGDDPDTSFARKGFLAYDAGKPGEKGSYKLPFAKIVDGRLTASKSGLRAAASRLPQTDLPDAVKEKARAVIDHYEAKGDKAFRHKDAGGDDDTLSAVKDQLDAAIKTMVGDLCGHIADDEDIAEDKRDDAVAALKDLGKTARKAFAGITLSGAAKDFHADQPRDADGKWSGGGSSGSSSGEGSAPSGGNSDRLKKGVTRIAAGTALVAAAGLATGLTEGAAAPAAAVATAAGVSMIGSGVVTVADHVMDQLDVHPEVRTEISNAVHDVMATLRGDDGEKSHMAPRAKFKIKGLYEVGQLARVLADLGYQENYAEWERECEGDQSKVPEMLANALRVVADALLAMTKEEIAELLGEEVDEGQLSPETLAAYKVVKPGLLKAMIAGRIKSGRKISAETEKTIRGACESIKSGHDDIWGLLGSLYDDDPQDDNSSNDESDTDKSRGKIMTKRQRLAAFRLRQAAE